MEIGDAQREKIYQECKRLSDGYRAEVMAQVDVERAKLEVEKQNFELYKQAYKDALRDLASGIARLKVESELK